MIDQLADTEPVEEEEEPDLEGKEPLGYLCGMKEPVGGMKEPVSEEEDIHSSAKKQKKGEEPKVEPKVEPKIEPKVEPKVDGAEG